MKVVLRKFDKLVGKAIGQLPKTWYRSFEVVSLVARPGVWAGLLVVHVLICFMAGEVEWAQAGFATLGLIPLSTAMKFVTRRDRPVSMYTDALKIKSYSFPSSHAYTATLGGGFLVMLLGSLVGGPLAYILAALAVCIVVAVGVSRVYLKAHFPSDVFGGVLLAVAALTAVMVVFGVDSQWV